MRTFRLPQAVKDTIADAPQPLLDTENPVLLSKVQQMHALLSSSKVDENRWLGGGGHEGLRWARKILKQEGLLQTAEEGNARIPALIDLQLGPEIIVGICKTAVDETADLFASIGVPASVVSFQDDSLVFFPAEVISDELKVAGDAQLDLSDVAYGEMVIVDESRTKLRSIAKSVGDHLAGFSISSLGDSISIGELEVTNPHVLSANDVVKSDTRIMKVDEGLGLVFGWAVICKINGEPYFDTQGDHLTEDGMLEAATDFMVHHRDHHVMHQGEDVGTVAFAWPMTEEIQKAFGVSLDRSGLMIAIKPGSDEVLQKFREGEYTGFSIGGSRIPEFTQEVD